MAGCTVAVRIRYRGFETVLHGCKLKRFVQHEMDIYPVVEKLFHESYRRGEPVRLTGVHVAELISVSELRQQELFVVPAEPDDLSQACDEIRDLYGERAIGFASGVFFSGGRPISNSRRTHFYSAFSRGSWLR